MSSEVITKNDLTNIINELFPHKEDFATEYLGIPWGGTIVQLYKRGVVVQGVIWNPTTVSAGDNSITTLPASWWPVTDCLWISKAPNSTSSGVELRFRIAPTGVFSVYNYGSAWTNTNSNISSSFTYVVKEDG